jgi:hypothetical protein
MWEMTVDFLSWIGERSLAKLLFSAVLALPVLAFLGYTGLLSRRRNKKDNEDSGP